MVTNFQFIISQLQIKDIAGLALPLTYGALCSGRSVIRKAGPPKLLLGVKVRYLDQISKRPCQPDMSLGFYSVDENIF